MWQKFLIALVMTFGMHAATHAFDLSPAPTSVANDVSTSPGYIYAWTSRGADRAIAFRVYEDGGVMRGTFRQYVLVDDLGEKSFEAKPTVLKFDATPLPAQKAISFTLASHPTIPGGFTINYQHAGVSKVLGWVRFTTGHGDRASSDVLIRLNRDVVLPPVMAAAAAASSDPCAGPPVDDVGEEELITNSNVAGEGNIPGKSLNFKALPPPSSPPPPPPPAGGVITP